MSEEKHLLTDTSVLQSSHKMTYIFFISRKFICSWNSISFHFSKHRCCWELWPCPFLRWVSQTLFPFIEDSVPCPEHQPSPCMVMGCLQGRVEAGGLCLRTALLESQPALSTPPLPAALGCHFTSCQVSQPPSPPALFYVRLSEWWLEGGATSPQESSVWALWQSFSTQKTFFSLLFHF